MKNILSTVFLFIQLSAVHGYQPDNPQEKSDLDYYYHYFELYQKYAKKGDFLKCEETLLDASRLKLSEYRKASVYINLGVTYFNLGNFEEALKAYSRIDTLNLTPDEIDYVLPGTLVNRAIIYGKRKIYDRAILYYERAIRILEQTAKNDKLLLRELSLAYHDLGTVYSERGEFPLALKYFNQSLVLMERYEINEKELPLSTLAKCYARLQNSELAEAYFRRCIETVTRENGREYYRLYEVNLLYAGFLSDEHRYPEALAIYRNVLNYFISKYGVKNTHTSNAYKNIGELKRRTLEYDSSLYFYQRSLISVVNNFNDENIEHNPGIDSSFFNIRLLDNLKGKSKVLEEMAGTLTSPEEINMILRLSLSTLELAIDLTDVIRNNFPTEESRIYLSENEKETYISGIRIASNLYGHSGNDSLLTRMYGFVQKSKAAVLRNQISENKILDSFFLSDSLVQNQHRLAENIAGYKMIIFNEENSVLPDKNMINLWKDEVFEMNRQKEAIDQEIAEALPHFSELTSRTALVPVKKIMKNLEKNEVVLDYSLSEPEPNGKRDLFIFIINRTGLKFYRYGADSLFNTNALILKNTSDPLLRDDISEFRTYLSALHYMYITLIKPVEKQIKNKRLIIIPDEEISWLPFDAFITEIPEGDRVDFENAHFLMYDYSISHAYSSSLITPGKKENVSQVFAFAPEYDNSSGFNNLNGARTEIESIQRIMGGKLFTSPEASRSNFLRSMQDSVIIHLAMHSVYDSTNSLYSYLLFDRNEDSGESARLYNYEISLSRISTPMIVLSSCNSGAGMLYQSEGLMSIARSFILAGASSVVRTAWEVNDDTGQGIITRFYVYLSKGYAKDKALQMAKINFIKESSPSFSDPYYWAAYEILGDNSPVRQGNGRIVTIVTISALSILAGIYFYLRRRRILAARLL